MKTAEIKINDQNVTGYDREMNEQSAGIVALHMQQFCSNYELAFGKKPTRGDLDAAFHFMELFFAEIKTVYPQSSYSKAVSLLQWLQGRDALAYAEHLAHAANKEMPSAAEWFLP